MYKLGYFKAEQPKVIQFYFKEEQPRVIQFYFIKITLRQQKFFGVFFAFSNLLWLLRYFKKYPK